MRDFSINIALLFSLKRNFIFRMLTFFLSFLLKNKSKSGVEIPVPAELVN